MKSLLCYLKKYIRECIFAPLFKLLEALFELIVPIVVAAVIDTGITGQDKGYVVSRVFILIGLAAVGLLCSVTAQYFASKAAAGFGTELRHSLFTHIEQLSFSETDATGTSGLITVMTSDVNAVQSCVNMILRLFLRSPFIVFGAMIMAFFIDIKSALIFCVAIPVLTAVVFAIMLVSIPLYRKVQSGLDSILKITRENLNGTRVIRAFNKEQEEINNFNFHNEKLTGVQLFTGRISSLMNPLTFVIVNVAIVVLIYTGALKVDAGTLKQGQVIALVNYMSQILVELIKLANLIIQITKAMASANRIKDIFEIENTMEFPESTVSGIGNSKYAVEFNNVSLTYKNAGAASVSGLNLKVKKGETIGIIGGTGSGKTTLVHMIPRFYDATSGEVKVNGINVRDYSKKDIRGIVGIVMQKAVLFEGSVRENIQWGKKDADDDEIIKALKSAQALDFVMEKEGGLDYKITQGGRNLSGGQKQRLTIARALVRMPQILILDDSASALDYATDKRLRESISAMDGDITTFIVSQRTASLRTADRIVVLEDGEVAGIGTHDELINKCSVYRDIYSTDGNREKQEENCG